VTTGREKVSMIRIAASTQNDGDGASGQAHAERR